VLNLFIIQVYEQPPFKNYINMWFISTVPQKLQPFRSYGDVVC